MRIGIDALTLVHGHTGGVETYIRNLIAGIGSVDTQNEYVVFALPQAVEVLDCCYENIKVEKCRLYAARGLGTYLRVLYQQLVLPRRIKRLNIDVMIFAANMGSIHCPCPSVLIIHDLIRHYCAANLPGQMGYIKEKILPGLIGASAEAATRIVAISEFTKRDIIDRLAIPAEKIEVVPNGIDECLLRVTAASSGKEIFKKIRRPYILFVGYHHPHKNLMRLVQAFSMMQDRTKTSHSLVIAGGKEAGTPALMRQIKALGRKDIFVLGAVSSNELAELYKKASLFVLPSLIEGFGLPLVEAMSFGVPIAASNAASIPEVVGDAAVLFDPEDLESMASAMASVLGNSDLSQELSRRGYVRLEETNAFSWRKTAKRLVAIAEKTGGQISAGFELAN